MWHGESVEKGKMWWQKVNVSLDGFDNDKKKVCEWHKSDSDAGHRQVTAWVGNIFWRVFGQNRESRKA